MIHLFEHFLRVLIYFFKDVELSTNPILPPPPPSPSPSLHPPPLTPRLTTLALPLLPNHICHHHAQCLLGSQLTPTQGIHLLSPSPHQTLHLIEEGIVLTWLLP